MVVIPQGEALEEVSFGCESEEEEEEEERWRPKIEYNPTILESKSLDDVVVILPFPQTTHLSNKRKVVWSGVLGQPGNIHTTYPEYSE